MNQSHPDHWKSYAAAANWYRLWYPPEWQVKESAEGVVLTDNEGCTLTISCNRVSDLGPIDLDSPSVIGSRLENSKNVQRLPGLNISYPSRGFEGEEIDEQPHQGSWLTRLPFSARSRKWRAWVILSEALCVTVICREATATDERFQSDTRTILNSLSCAAEPADLPKDFARRILKLARETFPLLESKLGNEFQLKLGESNVNLFNFYRSYVKAPERFREIVLPALTTVVQVQEWGTTQTEPPLEEVRDRIFPMLYPESVWRESFPNFIGIPWIADLMILYVVDEPQAYWYIHGDLLGQWDLDCDDLHQLALENLDRHFEENPMEFTMAGEEDGPRLLMPNRPDAYNATRILSKVFHGKLRELLGKELVIGIPSRDFFVAVSLDSDEMIQQVQSKVTEDHATMDHPICNQLLLISLDGVSQYCHPDGRESG